MSSTDPLLNELFPPAGAAEWRQQLLTDLKGTDPASLRWATPEGFTLEPFYTRDDLADLPLAEIQAAQKPTPGWLTTPFFVLTDPKTDNERLRSAVAREAQALLLRFTSVPDAGTLARLLDGIKPSETPVFALTTSGGQALDLVRHLKTFIPYALRGGLLTDSYDATTYKNLAEATRLTADSPQFRSIGLRSHRFHQAGATATQELAFTLAALAEAYDHLTEAGLDIRQLLSKTMLSVPVGTSFFVELAKLRALRVLLNRFQQAWQIEPQPVFIHAETSTFYYAAVEPYTNLLRATTEAMAAVMGGCDALTVYPHDLRLSGADDEHAFAERIARNIPILLAEEAQLGSVADPAAGAYALEHLTHQLVENAWALFLEVENQGGLTAAHAFAEAELARSYQAKQEAIEQGKVLVGVTKFRPEQTQPLEADPQLGKRLAADFE